VQSSETTEPIIHHWRGDYSHSPFKVDDEPTKPPQISTQIIRMEYIQSVDVHKISFHSDEIYTIIQSNARDENSNCINLSTLLKQLSTCPSSFLSCTSAEPNHVDPIE